MSDERLTQLQLYDIFLGKKRLVLVIAFLATIVTALFAISAGSLSIPVPEVIKAFWGNGEAQARTVILNIRLPRVIAAVIVGATLAVSGAVMQCVLQNPLASASTLGVSQGAAFGAALGIIVFGGGVVNSDSAATAISIMLVSMGICSLSAAVAVSFVGIISFVGLVAPHIMRRFVGNDYRYLVPCSAVVGALLLILADTFGRLIIAPVILPIGAITSFLGAPMFLFLLFRGFKRYD